MQFLKSENFLFSNRANSVKARMATVKQKVRDYVDALPHKQALEPIATIAKTLSVSSGTIKKFYEELQSQNVIVCKGYTWFKGAVPEKYLGEKNRKFLLGTKGVSELAKACYDSNRDCGNCFVSQMMSKYSDGCQMPKAVKEFIKDGLLSPKKGW